VTPTRPRSQTPRTKESETELTAIAQLPISETSKTVLKAVYLTRRLEESLVALIDRPDFTVPNIFGVIDRSSNQNITFSEFRDTYQVFEVAVTSADLQLLFARYDSRGADALSLEDFKKMFSPKDVNSRVLLLCRPYLRG
jgi:hypothetical protein